MIEFYQRLRKGLDQENIPVLVEPKIDGVAVSIVYENRQTRLRRHPRRRAHRGRHHPQPPDHPHPAPHPALGRAGLPLRSARRSVHADGRFQPAEPGTRSRGGSSVRQSAQRHRRFPEATRFPDHRQALARHHLPRLRPSPRIPTRTAVRVHRAPPQPAACPVHPGSGTPEASTRSWPPSANSTNSATSCPSKRTEPC